MNGYSLSFEEILQKLAPTLSHLISEKANFVLLITAITLIERDSSTPSWVVNDVGISGYYFSLRYLN